MDGRVSRVRSASLVGLAGQPEMAILMVILCCLYLCVDLQQPVCVCMFTCQWSTTYIISTLKAATPTHLTGRSRTTVLLKPCHHCANPPARRMDVSTTQVDAVCSYSPLIFRKVSNPVEDGNVRGWLAGGVGRKHVDGDDRLSKESLIALIWPAWKHLLGLKKMLELASCCAAAAAAIYLLRSILQHSL